MILETMTGYGPHAPTFGWRCVDTKLANARLESRSVVFRPQANAV